MIVISLQTGARIALVPCRRRGRHRCTALSTDYAAGCKTLTYELQRLQVRQRCRQGTKLLQAAVHVARDQKLRREEQVLGCCRLTKLD